MLSNTLNTNEIKNSAGTEVEFQRLSTSARATEFAQITEAPNQPHRLKISHQESGSGLAKRRRSVVRFDKVVASTVDTTKTCTVSSYLVLDAPVGALISSAEFTNVVAEVLSFCASLGASTTILYDGTGNGATALITGGL
jgi:hypothetical protein